ncbi:MAG TPA: tRNA (adenosine(37)-N6)-threonylcarbamoyltransferase complex dimerization subunit type 1 TsaB [Thermoanaerobaculia bacterium]|nr:tRNA (adenosine(37)-N6)-threonylcarbamoyltransferase complex dimerization subunit type 1 TsaB [Thermoanaerobaculia bacterium]
MNDERSPLLIVHHPAFIVLPFILHPSSFIIQIMLILAADTSLPLFSVALLREGDLLGAVALEAKGSRNEKLLPAIDWLLSENAVDRRSIDLFAVTRGPGSFTGVRIGMATIQGLALVLGRPVCAMSTHEAIALGSGRTGVALADEAGRGEFYVSRYEGGVETLAPSLAAAPEAGTLMVSDFLQRENVAVACARRAHTIASANQLDRYADVTPIYVRLAEAEVKLQQKRNAG